MTQHKTNEILLKLKVFSQRIISKSKNISILKKFKRSYREMEHFDPRTLFTFLLFLQEQKILLKMLIAKANTHGHLM